MRRISSWYTPVIFMWCVVILVCPGCGRETLNGTVTDTVGERLPGVAVSLTDERGRETQTLSNGQGEYSLPFETGHLRIAFLKNGYTTGHVELAITESSARTITPVALWRLPLEEGIFTYENNRYRRLTPFEPRTVVAQATNTVTFGIQVTGAVEEITTPEPLLLLRRFPSSDLMHRVPAFDVQVSRLAPVQTFVSGNSGPVQETWVQSGVLVSALDPIDEPERYLIQVKLTEPLTPGMYAVHWGAFSGYTRSETRAFVFRVPEPPAQDVKAKPEAKTEKAKESNSKAAASPTPAKK